MCQNLDPVITADKCFQYVDDIGIGAYDADMIDELRAVFSCILESGLKLATDKCQFGRRKIQCLGNTITLEGPTSVSQKLENFLMPKTTEQVKRIIGFYQFYKGFMPELSEKLLPFYKFLKKEANFEIEEEHKLMLRKKTNYIKNASNILP